MSESDPNYPVVGASYWSGDRQSGSVCVVRGIFPVLMEAAPMDVVSHQWMDQEALEFTSVGRWLTPSELGQPRFERITVKPWNPVTTELLCRSLRRFSTKERKGFLQALGLTANHSIVGEMLQAVIDAKLTSEALVVAGRMGVSSLRQAQETILKLQATLDQTILREGCLFYVRDAGGVTVYPDEGQAEQAVTSAYMQALDNLDNTWHREVLQIEHGILVPMSQVIRNNVSEVDDVRDRFSLKFSDPRK